MKSFIFATIFFAAAVYGISSTRQLLVQYNSLYDATGKVVVETNLEELWSVHKPQIAEVLSEWGECDSTYGNDLILGGNTARGYITWFCDKKYAPKADEQMSNFIKKAVAQCPDVLREIKRECYEVDDKIFAKLKKLIH